MNPKALSVLGGELLSIDLENFFIVPSYVEIDSVRVKTEVLNLTNTSEYTINVYSPSLPPGHYKVFVPDHFHNTTFL